MDTKDKKTLVAKLKKIHNHKNESDRPKDAFSRREIGEVLNRSEKTSNDLIFRLVKNGELEYAGKMKITNVCGNQYRIPTYRFIDKKKK